MTKLFVIPGHGAGDPGAGGNGYDEAERVRALATKIKQYGGDNVILADFSRNYYEDNGISSLDLDSDTCIVELHMDSGPSSARGGHVIIQAGIGGPDDYDYALESLMARIFPGRANTLVERDDLANPARAAAMGYNYRLVENGFISNADDVATFNNRMDEIARGYLQAFGIEAKPVQRPKDWPLIVWPTNGADNQKFTLDKKGAFYMLRCKADKRVLDVAQSKLGGDVILYDAHGGANQLWKLNKLDGMGTYEIESALKAGYVLDAKGNASEDGGGLCCYKRHGGQNQKWHLVPNGDGTYNVVSCMARKLVLDCKGGGK